MQKLTLTLVAFFAATLFSFAQQNTTLLGHLEYDEDINDVWGYYDEITGKEYALVGADYGFSIVDVSDVANPVELHKIPGGYSLWRDVKVWGHYAYVVDDLAGEGLLIVNLENLPDEITYDYWEGDPALGVDITTAHNIYIDEKGFLYVFGAAYTLTDGAIILDVNQTPADPIVAGAYDERYIHDGFVRGDTLFAAEINDGRVSIVDVSDKSNPTVLGFTNTPNFFSHNCWVSDDGKSMFTTDEVNGAYLTAYDISDVEDIQELDRIQSSPGENPAPHNSFVHGNYLFTSYYRDGLTIHDITHPSNMIQVGHYDSSPLSGGGFDGAWGTYPYLPSGAVLITDMQEGLFIVQANLFQACYLTGTVTDADTGVQIPDAKVTIEGTGITTETGFEGTYETGLADADFYDITFSKPGYEPLTITGILLANGFDQVTDAALIPLPSFELTGQVIDDNGNGVGFATVNFKNDEFDIAVQTFSNGAFSAPGFFEGEYDIIASAWGYNSQLLSAENIPFGGGPIVVELPKGYYDDFATDLGWTSSGTSQTGGEWIREVPVGTSFGPFDINPGDDVAIDLADKCYMTGNDGTFDFVNGGTVRLTSPTFDLTTYGDPYVSFHTWFINIGQYGPANDSLVVLLSDGFQEVPIETFVGPNVDGEWVFSNHKITDYLEPSSIMRLIFEARADENYAEGLEAGVDLFQVVDSAAVVGIAAPTLPSATDIIITASPNPFGDKTTIQIHHFEQLNSEQRSDLQFNLYDLTGRLVRQQVVNKSAFEVQKQQLAKGMYFYNIATGTEVLGNGKLLIN